MTMENAQANTETDRATMLVDMQHLPAASDALLIMG